MEIVDSFITESFLNAFQKFTAFYRCPTTIISDNQISLAKGGWLINEICKKDSANYKKGRRRSYERYQIIYCYDDNNDMFIFGENKRTKHWQL